MSDLLKTIGVDVEEILEDLRYDWTTSDKYHTNRTLLTKVSNKGENIMACCPFHNETNPSFGIQANYPYTYNCFGCGAKGNLATLVTHILSLSSELEGYHYINKTYTVSSIKDRKRIDIDSILNNSEADKKRTLPDSSIDAYLGKHHPYMASRGLSQRTLTKYEVGYDEETHSITFPVRTSTGQIRFINRRSVDTKRFLNEKNIYKKDILYGLYYLLQAGHKLDSLFMTESIIDTMSCYQNGLPSVAVMGRILFQEQLRELLLAGVKQVNLFFDNDEHGLDCTIKTYNMLSKTPIRVNVIIYPECHFGIDTADKSSVLFKDGNDLLKFGRMKDIEVVSYIEFYKRLSKGVTE